MSTTNHHTDGAHPDRPHIDVEVAHADLAHTNGAHTNGTHAHINGTHAHTNGAPVHAEGAPVHADAADADADGAHINTTLSNADIPTLRLPSSALRLPLRRLQRLQSNGLPSGRFLPMFGEGEPLGPSTVRLVLLCDMGGWIQLMHGSTLVNVALLIQGRIGPGQIDEVEFTTPTTLRQARMLTGEEWAISIRNIMLRFGAVMNREQREGVEALARVYTWFAGSDLNEETRYAWWELREILLGATAMSRRLRTPGEDLMMFVRQWAHQSISQDAFPWGSEHPAGAAAVASPELNAADDAASDSGDSMPELETVSSSSDSEA